MYINARNGKIESTGCPELWSLKWRFWMNRIPKLCQTFSTAVYTGYTKLLLLSETPPTAYNILFLFLLLKLHYCYYLTKYLLLKIYCPCYLTHTELLTLQYSYYLKTFYCLNYISATSAALTTLLLLPDTIPTT